LLAIEPADSVWPPLPGKNASAGPFYIVWTGASAATIRSEQWPYQGEHDGAVKKVIVPFPA
jgi:hypothetical protein